MSLVFRNEKFRSAQRAYDDMSPPEREELDDVALAALQASPVMLEETFGDQPTPWFAKAARLLDAGDDLAFAALCREARNAYVKSSVEDVRSSRCAARTRPSASCCGGPPHELRTSPPNRGEADRA